MKLAGCFNGTKTSYMSKNQGKFDFSYHDPFYTICFNTFFFFQIFPEDNIYNDWILYTTLVISF